MAKIRVSANECKSTRFTFILRRPQGVAVVHVCYAKAKKERGVQRWDVHLEIKGFKPLEYGNVGGQPNKTNAASIISRCFEKAQLNSSIFEQ